MHETDQPAVWLTLSSLQANTYDPSVRVLLEASVPHLKRVFQLEDTRGKVVTLRVR